MPGAIGQNISKIDWEWKDGDPEMINGLEIMRLKINRILDALQPNAPGNGGGAGEIVAIAMHRDGKRIVANLLMKGAETALE